VRLWFHAGWRVMCCGPDHIGAPPEWYRELRDGTPAIPLRGRGGTIPAATLAAWVRLLEPRNLAATGSPRSTEAGAGHAVPARWGHMIMPAPPPTREQP
jgi:hypothetical protein